MSHSWVENSGTTDICEHCGCVRYLVDDGGFPSRSRAVSCTYARWIDGEWIGWTTDDSPTPPTECLQARAKEAHGAAVVEAPVKPKHRKRKSLSKRLRFEIFKRDGFKCLYCGATPAQKVLRVDHVTPVAEGGADDPINLVTSCFDCNAGKGPVPLEFQQHAVGFATEADKEHAEQIREWLAIQREVEEARLEVAGAIGERWETHLGPISQEMFDRLPLLSKEFEIDALERAMIITARRYGRMVEYDYKTALDQQKYFSGILRNWRKGKFL